jgi:signal peptidase I
MPDPNPGPSYRPLAAPSSAVPGSNHTQRPGSMTPLRGQTQRRPDGKPEAKDGVREIIETVVFVVVLVLLLKSFVAEAFVIPTGSMAETLWGYQKIVKCPECGYEFPVNCSSEVDPQQGSPDPVVACTCPNCLYYIDFNKEHMNPEARTGDRVLVGKFLYDLDAFGMNMPQRYQVVVFKFPNEPQKKFVPTNYIKRLIGLPRETIAIHYGKLYAYQGDELHYDDLDRQVNPLELWQKYDKNERNRKASWWHESYLENGEIRGDPEAIRLFHEGKFQILRKPPAQVLSERRIVYDNAHQARDLLGKVKPRWSADGAAEAWTTDDPAAPRRFEHTGGSGTKPEWLRYHHRIPNPERTTDRIELINDLMGYNTQVTDSRRSESYLGGNWVGDLQLECEVQVGAAPGELILELSKGVDRFRARFDVSSGDCRLVRLPNGKDGSEVELAAEKTSLKGPGTYRLRFANVDERLLVWVNSSLPFGDGVSYDPPPQLGPTEENDFEPASIGVAGTQVTVSQLRLWRDTYYTSNPDRPAGSDSGVVVDLGDPRQWEALKKLPVRTFYVHPDHFLCLGDNSPESSDGRSWGLVPKRLLLGRALLIYYPLSRAGRIE